MAKTTPQHPKSRKRGRHEAADGGTLTPRQAAFVQAYAVGDKSATAAAIAAGYSPKSARAQVYDLMRNPGVKAELEGIHERITQRTVYDAAAAFDEAGEGIELARKSGNAHALVKAVELRAKLHGLLTDRLQVDSVSIDLIGALQDAKARLHPRFAAALRPTRDPAPAIEGECAALPAPCEPGATDNESGAPRIDLAAARVAARARVQRAQDSARTDASAPAAPGPDIFS